MNLFEIFYECLKEKFDINEKDYKINNELKIE